METREQGMATRRGVLGDEHVAGAFAVAQRVLTSFDPEGERDG